MRVVHCPEARAPRLQAALRNARLPDAWRANSRFSACRRTTHTHRVLAIAQQGAGSGANKPSGGASVLSSILSLSSVPYSSYVPEPKTPLHAASAEIKQLWTIGVLVLMARSSTTMRLLICAAVALATALTLPPRLWRPQLARVAGVCSLLFVFTAIGADGVAPVLSDRSLPAAAAAAAGDGLPASMAQAGAAAGGGYQYVLFHLWFITITRRSLTLAVAVAGVSFVALQAASLCLVTTPPERMALAVGRALRPLGLLGVPVQELVLTVLLSLRFMATVFEEARNLCLGLASRGVDWKLQGARGTVALFIAMGTKLFSNLMARCGNIAQAMQARGFSDPTQHTLHVGPAPGGDGAWHPAAADLCLLGSLALLVGAAYWGL